MVLRAWRGAAAAPGLAHGTGFPCSAPPRPRSRLGTRQPVPRRSTGRRSRIRALGRDQGGQVPGPQGRGSRGLPSCSVPERHRAASPGQPPPPRASSCPVPTGVLPRKLVSLLVTPGQCWASAGLIPPVPPAPALSGPLWVHHPSPDPSVPSSPSQGAPAPSSVLPEGGPGPWPRLPFPGAGCCRVLPSPPRLQPGCGGWDGAVVNDFSGNNSSWGCRCLGHSCETQREFRLCVRQPLPGPAWI